MTEAPKRIWLNYAVANHEDIAFAEPPRFPGDGPDTQYILAAEHHRIVAEARRAALEEAAKVADAAVWNTNNTTLSRVAERIAYAIRALAKKP